MIYGGDLKDLQHSQYIHIPLVILRNPIQPVMWSVTIWNVLGRVSWYTDKEKQKGVIMFVCVCLKYKIIWMIRYENIIVVTFGC